jgi:hypothetical protein
MLDKTAHQVVLHLESVLIRTVARRVMYDHVRGFMTLITRADTSAAYALVEGERRGEQG